jgi:hypothetical protein
MKHNKKSIVLLLSLFVSIGIISGCGGGRSASIQESAKVVYLKNNIHVQEHEKSGEYRGSYANWTDPGKDHVVIPVNTPVAVNHSRGGFTIIIQSTKKPILFEVNEKNVGMSAEQYLLLITSPDLVRLDSLSEIDRKGIQEGKAYVGMTKDGVRIALGYPAPHKTASLGNSTWYYWTNRFNSIAIEFDENGKAKSIGK